MSASTQTASDGATSSACLWWDGLPRPAFGTVLEADSQTQIAIVGGGYTGLWTAFFLKLHNPGVAVTLIEAAQLGHGASSRNGGWFMGAIENQGAFTGRGGRLPEAVLRQLTQLVGRAGTLFVAHGIDCDFAHGGALMTAARHAGQTDHARAELAMYRALGYGEHDYQWLSPQQMQQRVSVAHCSGGLFTPHVARIQPAKLLLGLAQAVKAMGVTIHEHTPARKIDSGRVVTDRGVLTAEQIVLATEGYSEHESNPLNRRLVPIQTGMVATTPLPAELWEHIGLTQFETLADFSRVPTYLQRTADDRLVVGARGSYHPQGRPQHALGDADANLSKRRRIGEALIPLIRDAEISHCWGGSVGLSRHLCPHIVRDTHSRMITAGGYVGEGVGASFLFGETVADLLLGRDSELTQMPWIKEGSLDTFLPRWLPEPLPWLGVKLIEGLFAADDWCNTRYPGSAMSHALGWCCEHMDPR